MKTTRREFLGTALFAVGAGAAFTVCGKLPANIKEPISRPPGVADEDEFLSKCMRCKQCIYICQSSPEAGKVLFAAKLSDGFNVVNTPLLIEENGHECTACGLCATVCPSQAIAKIVPQFLADKCIGCFKCIPACPHDALTEGANGYPALNVDLCVGCGDCRTECEAANGNENGFPAIEMVSKGDLKPLPDSNPNKKVAYINPDGCIACAKRICFKACTYDAISYDESVKKSPCVVDQNKCTGCGDCVNSARPCDDDVITLVEKK